MLQDSSSLARVQIVPVLCCGSMSSGGDLPLPAMLVYASSAGGSSTSSSSIGSSRGSTHVALATLPVSMWLSVPFAERVQALLDYWQQQAQQAAAPPPAAPSSSRQAPGSGTRQAVSAAIDDILRDLQELRCAGWRCCTHAA